MPNPGKQVQRTYLLLTLLSTLSASFIWGINTLFLLDAGLSNVEAFTANAFFTGGMVLFEVPTGVVADTWGRRTSYLLGAGTLLVSTLIYLWMWHTRAALPGWAIASILLGLGFTFFSGATEAWLVDALTFAGVRDTLQSVLARGQVVGGAAMLGGSLTGGFVAQATNLGVPYIMRSVTLGLTLLAAFIWMKDLGFTPNRRGGMVKEVRQTLRVSIESGWGNPPVRWLMLAALFAGGVSIYGFYALQPYLLQLYGNPNAFAVASLSAAIVAGTQMLAGVLVPHLGRGFRRRSGALIATYLTSTLCLLALGLNRNFALAVALVVIWGLSFALRNAHPPDLHQRHHTQPAAGDGALIRQPDELGRRRSRPAGAGPSSRHLWLRPIVRGVCGDPGGGGAVPDAGPAGKSGVGCDRGGETEGRRGGDWPVGITYRRSVAVPPATQSAAPLCGPTA